MSMFVSFFNKGFKAAKCKTLLKLTMPLIKLLRNRREIQLKNMRREIAKLLETGQEATARIRVEHIIREENMMAAQEIIELFCELIAVRLPIIESQRYS
ncbi:putative vacuolar protein sorting-associated protein Ist1 [Lupinus albus]|uniref:Putative vacuolar protein sorting-associated protein Ist1 n=1 Tax=Lupinus albus TaxID=3870 RepID=A0A6A4R7B3_LUPAL|nr:putative vacuolar protein sorting-associated protein Ist1 [Lupinus albus]